VPTSHGAGVRKVNLGRETNRHSPGSQTVGVTWSPGCETCRQENVAFGHYAAFLACFAAFLLQTALLVFGKEPIVSRIFILLNTVVLFLCVVAASSKKLLPTHIEILELGAHI
jgi:hypothetical protein